MAFAVRMRYEQVRGSWVPCEGKYLGNMKKEDAMARAISISSSLTLGAEKMSWLDLALQVKLTTGAESFGTSLKERVFQVCPEYAKRINNWQHFQAITTRYSTRALERIEVDLAAMGLSSSELPQSWFREACMLGKTGQWRRRANIA